MVTQTGGIAPPAPAPFKLSAIMLPLVAIIVGTFMAILDNTVVNVALPTLVRVFKTNLSVIQWVATAYMLAQAAVIPLSGWLSDRFGAKRLYMISIVLFALGSALCAVAQTGPMLIAFRVLQGLGGGMLMPIGMAFIYRLAPPDKRGVVMGAFGIPILLAPALGPILAGWLVQYADWRWIFLINVPVGLLALGFALRTLPALAAQRAPSRLDVPGAILAPLAFASLSYGISESTSAGWTGTSTLAGLAVGSIALILFIIRELSITEPLLELRVFRSRDFALGSVTQWTVSVALFGAFFLLPLFLQQVRGYGAFDTGLFTLPMAVASGLFMPIGGRLFDRIGARPLVIVGLALVGISSWMLAHLTITTTGGDLRLALILRGAGMGLTMMPLNTHILNAAPRKLVGQVTSLTSAFQNVAGSLGIATLATVLSNRATTQIAAAKKAVAAYQTTAVSHALGHRVPAGVPSTGAAGGSAHRALPPDVVASISHFATNAFHAAMTTAFNDTFLVSMGVAFVGMLLGVTLRRRPMVATAPSAAAGEEHAGEGAFGLAV